MDAKFQAVLKKVAGLVLHLMALLVVLVMISGSAHVVWVIAAQVLNGEPAVGLVNVEELLAVFSLFLNIMIGYELFKSITIILKSDVIPVTQIIMIAGIAIANKIITLDFKSTDPVKVFALGAAIVCLGAGHYLYSRHTESK